MSKEHLTVSELNSYIKAVINSGFPQQVWVCGEIQQYDRNKNRTHIFFELVEKDPKTKEITARIGLVIFASKKESIQAILKQSENAFELKDDIEVKFACRVDFYAPHGAVRLIVENIDPTYTLGKIAQERQKLIAELKEKGILEKNKQLSLSTVPLRIGLITADDSAAYNDFVSELKRSGFAFQVFLRTAVMQGKNSEKDVCKALAELAKIEALDTVVITRGGGSIAELSCFDSKIIAEKIAGYDLPVLSGIGHEINLTITDLAAHTFAKTPTAIAQFLAERVANALEEMEDALSRIMDLTVQVVAEGKDRLKEISLRMHNKTLSYFQVYRENLVRIKELILIKQKVFLEKQGKELKVQSDSLRGIAVRRLDKEKKELDHCSKLVAMSHPSKIMKRGFSIARTKDGQLLRSVKPVKKDDQILLEVIDGKIESNVIKVTRDERQGRENVKGVCEADTIESH